MTSQLATMPELRVTVDGTELAARELHRLSGLRVRQRLSLPTQCELTFADAGADTDIGPGSSLRVAVAGREPDLFDGEVTAAEHVYGPSGEGELRVRGYDRLHRLRKQQTVRAWSQVRAGDVARDLAGGVEVSVAASDAGPAWQTLIQHRQSDLDFLTEVAERAGMYFIVRDGALHLLTLAGVGTTVPLELGQSLLEATVEVNAEGACGGVTVSGWDPLRAESRTGRAASPRAGDGGATRVRPEQVGAGDRTLVDEAVQTAEQADARAQAELDRRAAAGVTFRGIADGDPRLRPGTRVELSGVADRLAGRYVLTSVTHAVDARHGYISELSTAPPESHPRPAGTAMTLGLVTRIDDPDNLGRVKVALPAYGGVETDWMGVLTAGAGGGKGMVSLPDRNDQVLVLFARQDPAQGVVLGGLYGAGGPPDSGIEGGAVRRFTLLTPGGQRVRLDDRNRAIRLENSDGSFVDLAEGGVHLSAKRDLVIEAPGRSVVIRGQTVDFQQG